jgi:hypothetical protein
MIKKLELEKAEIEAQKQTGYKLRIKEIESKIKDIYEKAEKLIDLSNQIILGLDTPQDSLFDAIMALIVVRPHIGDIIAYQHGLHFCQEVYPYRNQNKVSSNT